MFRLILILSLSLALYSCGSQESNSSATTEEVAAPEAKQSLSFALTRNGVGSLNSESVLNAQNVAKAFPGFAQREMTGEGYYYFITYWENEPAFRIYADPTSKKVTSVIITQTDFIEGPKATIGDTHAQVQEGFQSLSCQAGTDNYEGQILCRTASAENIQYVFDLANWTGSKKKLPADDVVATAVLKEIIWQAPK